MFPRASILIVDRSDDTREVLSTALERRGMTTLASRCAEQAVDLAREYSPDLIVMDLETLPEGGKAAAESFQTAAGSPPAMVLLGSARQSNTVVPDCQFVVKPYHYGPLILRIEELIAESRRAAE